MGGSGLVKVILFTLFEKEKNESQQVTVIMSINVRSPLNLNV